MTHDEKRKEWLRKAEEERQAIAKAVCIESDFIPITTVYNQASGIIIASVERRSAERLSRLFFRHSSERSYRPLGSPAPDIHYKDLLTSPTLPVIYYTVWRFTKCPGEQGGYGGDWLSVDRFDLGQHTTDTLITKGSLQLPQPYSGGWVSSLFSVAPDDSAIFCSCGLMERPEKGRVHYWACSIAPRSQRVTLLSRLEGIYF